VRAQPGDTFEIEVPEFGRPLTNKLVADTRADRLVEVGVL
jgi:hypothetical protein